MRCLFSGKLIGSLLFLLYFWYCLFTPLEWHFIDTVNLIFHEAGHSIFIFFSPLLAASAGSLFQIIVPTSCVIYFYQRGEYLSAQLLMLWIAQNILNVSVYVRDAVAMNVSLLGGEGVIHDWNFILTELDILNKNIILADFLVVSAYLLAIASSILIMKQYFR